MIVIIKGICKTVAVDYSQKNIEMPHHSAKGLSV